MSSPKSRNASLCLHNGLNRRGNCHVLTRRLFAIEFDILSKTSDFPTSDNFCTVFVFLDNLFCVNLTCLSKFGIFHLNEAYGKIFAATPIPTESRGQ